MEDQEECCRLAKIILDKHGNKEKADFHYYREMEAARKQKKLIPRFFEWLLIQSVFRYGTSWYGVLFAWLGVVLLWGFIFFWWDGIRCNVGAQVMNKGFGKLVECIYFSVITAATVGYGDYSPKPGIFQFLAGIEAIFGTFMWAAFITIFARKYMR
jgi:Ion channel.